MREAFNNKKYLQAQHNAFGRALRRTDERPVFIEFGGKPFGDQHAERVLPGYERDSKAELLREVTKMSEVVMVVNALDILLQPNGRTLRGRIRGDTGLPYEEETVRLLRDAHARDIPLRKVVVAVTPRMLSAENQARIHEFRSSVQKEGAKLLVHSKLDGYPDAESVELNQLADNDRAWEGGNLVAISPGGGSGKFGMLLSEMYGALSDGYTPDFVKFETFPIYQLDAEHALNLAFEAATADLKNRVVTLPGSSAEIRTTYDKDEQNFLLLRKLFDTFGKADAVSHIQDPVDLGVNRIIDGIEDMDAVIAACGEEIIRRIQRYESEVVRGIERMETLEIARRIFDRQSAYRIRTSAAE